MTSADPNDAILAYSIAYGNDAGSFAISNKTGAISVVSPLDYQVAQTYTLLVFVSKVALPSFQTGCTVFINGAHDDERLYRKFCHVIPAPIVVVPINHAPIVPSQLLFVDESLAAVTGASVGMVYASDTDNPARTAGSGRPAVYVPAAWYAMIFNLTSNAFENGTTRPLFSINSTSGALTISTPSRWTIAQGQFWFSNQLVRATYAINASVCNPSSPPRCSFAPVTVAVVSNYTAPPSPLILTLSVPTGGLGTVGGDTVSFQGTQLAVNSATRATYCSNVTGVCYSAINCACTIATLITCTTVPGFGSSFVWNITQGGVAVPSVGILVTQYAPPVISSVITNPMQPLTSAGGAVSIFGKNFGPPAALPFLSIVFGGSGMFSMVPTFTNHTLLTAILGPGCGFGLPVSISVAGIASSSVNPSSTAINFAPPAIASISSSSGQLFLLSTLGGDDITIDGAGFGPLSAVISASYSGGVPGFSYTYSATCRKDDASRAHTRVICSTSPGVSVNFSWTLAVCGQSSVPSSQTTSYIPPTILSITGSGVVNAATDGGQSMTVFGTSFGPPSSGIAQGSTPTVTSVLYGLTYGNRAWQYSPTCTVSSAFPSTLTCLSVPGTGANLSLQLSIGGQRSNILFGVVSYGSPVISQFSGASIGGPTAGGALVTLTGFNYGYDAKYLSVSYSTKLRIPRSTDGLLPGVNGSVTFLPAACSITIPHHEITCTLAPGAGSSLQWTLVVDGLRSTGPFTSFAAPSIASVALQNGASVASPDGGSVVLLLGTNFGPAELIQRVRYGPSGSEFRAQNFSRLSDSALLVTLGPGIGHGLSLTVTVADQTSAASDQTFDFAAPTVSSVSPTSADAVDASKAPSIVTVFGSNFGLLVPSASVGLGFGNAGDGSFIGPLPIVASYPSAADLRRPNFTWVPGSQQWVQFPLPPGLGANRSVRVVAFPTGQPPSRANILGAISSVRFSFNPPRVDFVVVVAVTALADSAALSAAFPGASQAALSAALKISVFGESMGPSATVTGDSVIRAVDFQALSSYSSSAPWDSTVVVILNWTSSRLDGFGTRV